MKNDSSPVYKGRGLWVKLSVDFQMDAKVLSVSAEAELLFIRAMAYAKRQNNDWIPSTALPLLGLKFVNDVQQVAEELVNVGLWEVAFRGYRIVGWGNWQTDREALSSRSRGGSLGAHRRWHKDARDPDCPYCDEQMGQPIVDLMGEDGFHLMPELEKELELEITNTDDFDSFWKVYPRKVAKGDARKAWKQTAKKRPPLADVIAAVEAAKANWSDPKFIPFPASWLRAERWEDGLDSRQDVTERVDPMVHRVAGLIAPLRLLGADVGEAEVVLQDVPEPYRSAGLEFFRTGVFPL